MWLGKEVKRAYGALLCGKEEFEDRRGGKVDGDLNTYQERWGGLSLSLQLFGVKTLCQGIERLHVEEGDREWGRRTMTWKIIRLMGENIGEWEKRKDIVYIELALAYQLLSRVSELLGEEGNKVHEAYFLKRGGVPCFRGMGVQLGPGRRNAASTAREERGTAGEKLC